MKSELSNSKRSQIPYNLIQRDSTAFDTKKKLLETMLPYEVEKM